MKKPVNRRQPPSKLKGFLLLGAIMAAAFGLVAWKRWEKRNNFDLDV